MYAFSGFEFEFRDLSHRALLRLESRFPDFDIRQDSEGERVAIRASPWSTTFSVETASQLQDACHSVSQ